MPESVSWSEPPVVLRYGAAIAVVAAAVAAGALLQPARAPVVSLLLCGALFAAWFGGLGPGLLAIALGLLAFDYFFLPPLYSLAVQDSNDVVRLISFAVAALFVVALSAKQSGMARSLRRAHDDLQAAVRELERANASLRDENAERQRIEADLRQSEKNLQTIVDTIPTHVARYRADGSPDFVNQTLREFLGPGAVIGEMRSTVHPDDIRQNWRDWRAHIAAGEPHENEIRLRRADGVYRWHRIRRVPLRDANGAIVNWYGAGHDIDDQKRAETALRESEKSLQTIIDTIPAHVVRYRADGAADFMNQTLREFVGSGVGLDETGGTVHPDDFPQRLRDWPAHVAAGEPYENEMRVRRADGVYRWHRFRRVPLRDANGAIVNWYGAGHDIDDQKRAETALRESEAQLAEAKRELQAMIDTTPAMLGSYDAQGSLTYINKTGLDFTGVAEIEDVAERERIVHHPDEFHQIHCQWLASVAKGEPFQMELRLRRRDGEYRWISTRRVPLRDSRGTILKWYSTSVDIDDQKRVEDALRRSEAYLAEAQRLSRTGSFGWRIADNATVWSREMYRIFELDPAVKPTLEVVLERTHPDDVEFVQRISERMRNEDRDFDYEHRLLLPNGTITQLHVRAHRVRFESGDVEVIGALMDVTAARKAEEALRRAQAELAHAARVATLGELSASIAHEVNQPLAAIVTSGQAAIRWLDREVPEKERAHRAITRLLNEAERASQVIRRIRELAKKAEPEMAQVDVNSLVEDVVTLVNREALGQHVAVRIQLASELPPVRGDRIQLQQVLINLVINGIQAMASVTDRARGLAIRTQRHGDDKLLVAVEDAGIGIAPEDLTRLFSTFYTTKPDGMGMGLSISRSIVEAHGGQIWATHNSGPGTTFRFTLPAYREAAALSPV